MGLSLQDWWYGITKYSAIRDTFNFYYCMSMLYCGNPSELAVELLQSCTKPMICYWQCCGYHTFIKCAKGTNGVSHNFEIYWPVGQSLLGSIIQQACRRAHQHECFNDTELCRVICSCYTWPLYIGMMSPHVVLTYNIKGVPLHEASGHNR